MRIAGFVKTTLQDWEGKNACMILLRGCNFRCPYCNRPDLIEETGKSIELSTILKYIKEHRDFLEAAVVSGGEPTINDDLYQLLIDLKKLKIKIKLDTNGYVPDVLDDLIGARLVDKICINIMAPLDNASYSKAAGVDVNVELIKRSLKILQESEIPYEIRTVIVPGIITHESFVKLLSWIDGSKSMIIQQFNQSVTLDPKMNLIPYPKPALVKMAETAKGYAEKVRVRGM
jgi:pyruvate formate lyase activating enzyme